MQEDCMKELRLKKMLLCLLFVLIPSLSFAQGASSFIGNWLFRGIAGQNCSIAADGTGLRLITEKGVAGYGSVASADAIVVDFPFARGLRGQLTPDRNRINWSNGEFWTRASSPSFTGTWLFRGIAGQNCTIAMEGAGLKLVTEKGVTGYGSISSATSFVVDFPFAKGLKGQLTADGNRINWSNGEFWTRASGGTSGGDGNPGGCEDLTGTWYYRGDTSGHHFYANHQDRPGVWSIGGFEVDFNTPNDRWGKYTCLGNNRWEVKRSNGDPFIVATIQGDRLVKDDGTYYER
jgi:type 1 fimbria pilin